MTEVDSHSHLQMEGDDSSSDFEEIPRVNHEYSLAEVEPHYHNAMGKEGGVDASENSGGGDGEEGGGRRRESLSRSASQNSVGSDERGSAKDDDDDDDTRQRHDVRHDVYQNIEELDAYDKVIDELDNNNYYNKAAAEQKADESDREEREDTNYLEAVDCREDIDYLEAVDCREDTNYLEAVDCREDTGYLEAVDCREDTGYLEAVDCREDREERSGSRNSGRSSEARDDVHYEEVMADRELKSESGSEHGNEAEEKESRRHYENNDEDIYCELDTIRQEDKEEERQQGRMDSQSSDSDRKPESARRHSSSAEDFHDAPPKKSPTTPTAGSGKFVLRTVRNADALHFLRNIRNSDDNNPETDELVTILRTGKQEEEEKKKKKEKAEQKKLESFITLKLVHKFEKGIESVTEQQSNAEESMATVVVHRDDRTTVVKATVKDPTPNPLSPKSPTTPKSPSYSPGGYQSHFYASQTSRTQKPTYSNQTSRTSSASSDTPVTPTGDGSGVPNWKADIENRKKTKNHVPDQRPKEPMKMFEVPEWKRKLQDKNKAKKMNANSEEQELSLSKILVNPSAASLPLRVEMDQLKRDLATRSTDLGGQNKAPEWARIADGMKKPDINGNV